MVAENGSLSQTYQESISLLRPRQNNSFVQKFLRYLRDGSINLYQEVALKNFDITKFPGENVPIACLRLKAVAKALGMNDLPKNVIRKVLKGFSKSSTKSFNEFCASQNALRRGSLTQDIVKNTSLYSQLVGVLTNLDNSYRLGFILCGSPFDIFT